MQRIADIHYLTRTPTGGTKQKAKYYIRQDYRATRPNDSRPTRTGKTLDLEGKPVPVPDKQRACNSVEKTTPQISQKQGLNGLMGCSKPPG